MNSAFAQTLENLNNGFRSGGTVNCMKVDSTKGLLYIGGYFGFIDSTHSNGLALYDGNKWKTLGELDTYNGITPQINTIELFENQLIVGGRFNSIGGVKTNGIARWDGENWYSLDSFGFGPDTEVDQIIAYKDSLIVIGKFVKAGQENVTHIAKWKNNTWSIFYEEDGLIPHEAISLNNDLFLIVKKFTTGNNVFWYLRRYNGEKWHQIHIPNDPSIPFWSPSFRQGKDSIFVLGYGYSLCSIVSDSLRKISYPDSLSLRTTLFEKGKRDSFPSESFIGSTVNCFTYYNNDIIIGGKFNLFTPKPAFSLVKYGANQFNSIGCVGDQSIPYQINISASLYDSLRKRFYYSGNFSFADFTPARSIAYMDSSGFHSLGFGLNSHATKMALFRDTLYAIGTFAKSGPDSVGKLIKWNGNKWESVGKFFGGISNIEVYHDKLFLVGTFTKINDLPIQRLATYDGQDFMNYDSAYSSIQNLPYQIHVHQDTLFVFSLQTLRKSKDNYFETWTTNFLPNQFIQHPGGFYCTNSNEKTYTFHKYENGVFKSLPFPFESATNHKLVDIFGRIHVSTAGYNWYEFDGEKWSNYFMDESTRNNFTVQSSFKIDENIYLLAGGSANAYPYPNIIEQYKGLYLIKKEKPKISIFRNKDTLCVDEDFRYYAKHNSPFCKLEWHTPGALLSKGFSTYHFSEYDSAGSYPTTCHYYSRYGDGADTFSGPTIVRLCEKDKSPIEFRNVSIYPNPVNDYLIVDPGAFEINTIEIYNLSGQKVFELKDLIKTIRTIDIRFLKPGFYVYKSIANPSVDVFKILKL